MIKYLSESTSMPNFIGESFVRVIVVGQYLCHDVRSNSALHPKWKAKRIQKHY